MSCGTCTLVYPRKAGSFYLGAQKARLDLSSAQFSMDGRFLAGQVWRAGRAPADTIKVVDSRSFSTVLSLQPAAVHAGALEAKVWSVTWSSCDPSQLHVKMGLKKPTELIRVQSLLLTVLRF